MVCNLSPSLEFVNYLRCLNYLEYSVPSIYELMPDHEVLLKFEPEELAGFVLEHLSSLTEDELQPRFLFADYTVQKYPIKYQKEVKHALIEAWNWLKSEGLIARKHPGSFDDELIFITRKGNRLRNAVDLEIYCKANLLPRNLLHPVIAQKVYHLFLRCDYDIAILQAYKEVEVAVRDIGGYTETDYGVDLMRQAFHVDKGPLRDQNQPKAEREATAHMFAGAIGLYKNPHSHRNVPVTAEEAVEIIMFASHLLRIVDSRSPKSNAQ